MKNCFNEFNCGRRSLKDELRKGPPKNSLCVREHWCRVWTDNAISSCDIPWDRTILGHFFHQHTFDIAWTPGSRWMPHNLTIAQKKVCVDWCKEMLEMWGKKTIIRSSQVTNHGYMRLSSKQNNSPPFRSSKTTQIHWKKHFDADSCLYLRQN